MEGQYGPAAGSYYGGGGAGGGAGGDAPRKFKRKKPLDPTGFIMLHLENRLHYGSFRDQPVLQVRPHDTFCRSPTIFREVFCPRLRPCLFRRLASFLGAATKRLLQVPDAARRQHPLAGAVAAAAPLEDHHRSRQEEGGMNAADYLERLGQGSGADP